MTFSDGEFSVLLGYRRYSKIRIMSLEVEILFLYKIFLKHEIRTNKAENR